MYCVFTHDTDTSFGSNVSPVFVSHELGFAEHVLCSLQVEGLRNGIAS